MNAVHLIVPESVADPARPSGGNGYDRRVGAELADRGWRVREHRVGGAWPDAGAVDRCGLAGTLAAIPGGELVLIDGLIGSAAPEILGPAASRLRLVLLVHLPLEDEREAATLRAVPAVITTSEWTRRRLLDRYGLAPEAVHAVLPGADRSLPAPGSLDSGELLCVAALAPHKGQDVLVDALAHLAELSWRLALVGPLDRDPHFAAGLRARIERAGLATRISLPGPLADGALDRAYARADVLVLPSRGETYGMVVTEALARALPVIATAVGGVPEALGAAADGTSPGLLVRPDDRDALAEALRRWLTDGELRTTLRGAAARRREALPSWRDTAARIERALHQVAAA